MKPLTAIETSALCSNLAKGCEKQYQPEQAEAFRKLAAWFKAQSEQVADPSFTQVLERINEDLSLNYPAANAVSGQNGDRGALRSMTWSEKVTRILKSLLERYAREGEAMLEKTGVYVCTICGFVYVGNDLPEVCPVCKVPNRKFERIGG
jgi:rubrerythrin